MTKAEIIKYVFIFFKEYVMHSEDFQKLLEDAISVYISVA